MSYALNVFFSNHLDLLYLQLKKKLFTFSAPFTKRLIVVYGPAMKAWLSLKIAQDPDLNVSFGLEFVYLNQAFEIFTKFFHPCPKPFPSLQELSLAIEGRILAKLTHYFDLNEEEKTLFSPLFDYLQLDFEKSLPPFLNKKAQKRLTFFSLHLGEHFLNYRRFAPKMVQEWQTSATTCWQQALWKELFGPLCPWQALPNFKEFISSNFNLEIHFFSISFLSEWEFAFTSHLAKLTSLYYYLISPCALFWSDIRSDKESQFLQNLFEKKFGIASSQVEQLEELLSERNPLLANFGRMGREMVAQIEESSAQIHAQYALPLTIKNYYDLSSCENLYLYQTSQPLSLLQAVQADMLLMKAPEEELVTNLTTTDNSIQLHKAPSRRREIEILYHNLLALMQKQKELQPQEIIVMAPHIHDYIPYIKSFFGQKASLLDFQILDLGAEVTSELAQTFLALLALSESRWDTAQLLYLFEQPSFQRKFELCEADYTSIRNWTLHTNIYWGEDLAHRNELLKRFHCRLEMAEESEIGTWKYGITRLLLGLTHLLENETASTLQMQPCSIANFTDAELLGKWIELLHSLRDDLSPLHDETKMSIEDWGFYLKSLLESYLKADFEDRQSLEEWEELQTHLLKLKSPIKEASPTLFSFSSIYHHLKNLLKQGGGIYRENHLQTVRFCSLIPLRSIPAKVIALIGMQAEAFPRVQPFSGLNLAIEQEDKSYFPSTSDYDRFLFLEAIHSAKETLLISYPSQEKGSSKEQQPSLVVEELFCYLDRYYTIKGESVLEQCRFIHPLDPFDKSYFAKESRLANFSQENFLAAKALYGEKKQFAPRFISNFSFEKQTLSPFPTETVLDLKQLTAVAKHPIKFHLNHVLNIYLQESKERLLTTEEALKVSALDRYILKKNSLKQSKELVISQAEKEGRLPLGIFKTVAVSHLSKEIGEIENRLKKEELSFKDIFDIEFSLATTHPIKLSSQRWMFPAIAIDYSKEQRIYIIGKISHVTPKGIFTFSKDNLEGIWKIWPEFLAYQYACNWSKGSFEKNLILSEKQNVKKPFFEDPSAHLKKFISYYALCCKQFSPLMPQWLDTILKKDAPGLTKHFRQVYEESFGAYRSIDLKWALNRFHLPDPALLLQNWQPEAQELLGDLKQW